jgi:hypothetical protein
MALGSPSLKSAEGSICPSPDAGTLSPHPDIKSPVIPANAQYLISVRIVGRVIVVASAAP